MAKAQTLLKFVGGVNKDRIGGNCSVIEHTDEKGVTDWIMFDLGSMFTPYESGFTTAYPNVDEYFDRVDPKTGQEFKAEKPVKALFLTHAHEDHIGALVNYTKMGYKLPPIKAGGFTRNFIRLAFKKEGLEAPEIEKIKAGDNVLVGDNIVVEAVDVSHSIVDSLGFHTLTFSKGKPYAAIMNNGDFLTEEEMPVGRTFNTERYLDIFKRKKSPVTVVCLDSTSAIPDGKERIGFDKAVENVYGAVNRNLDRSVIISPVISRSVQNIAIDIETARRLNTKIYLDGKWLQTVKEAMTLSGYKDFDDVVYKGTMQGYLGDKRISKKYIVCTGAFAQGLENYVYNLGPDETAPIPMASATKMALGLHPYVKINKNVLVLARQRIIDEINGQTGPQMLQMLAAQGAKVIMAPYGKPIGGFEQIQMQDSGHVNAKALKELMDDVKGVVPDVIAVPIHGNPEQCRNVANLMDSVGVKSYVAENLEVMEVVKGKIERFENKVTPMTWYAVKTVFPNPLDDRLIPSEGLCEFWEINENYQPLRKVCEVGNGRKSTSNRVGGSSSSSKRDVSEHDDLPRYEPMRSSGKKNRMAKMLAKRRGRE